MHRRPALCFLTFALALVTAIALLGSASSFSAARVADPRSTAIEQVVRDFYAAVNQTIATGDQTTLDAVVSAQLVIDGALAALAPGRDGLVRYLASLHATHPQLELTVAQVVAARDQALIHLTLRGGEEASFLGSPVRGGPPPWSPVNAVTVAGGQVVAYWGGASGRALREPLGQTPFTIDAASQRLVSLDRLLIPPGASFAARGAEEARLFFVEAGTVTVTSTQLTIPQPIHQAQQTASMVPTEDNTPPQTSQPLTAGDFFSLPTWSRSDVYNEGANPASLLVLATGSVTTTAGWASSGPVPLDTRQPDHAGTGLTAWQAGLAQTSPSGAIVAPLTGHAITTLPGKRTVVALGRVTLAPGTTLSAPEATGPRLLVVEAGTLDLITGGEPAWVYRGGGTTAAGTLGVGDGAVLHADSSAMIQNTGWEPMVFTVIAMLPGDALTGRL